MYVVNSQEQKWLENALRNTPTQNVSWVIGNDYFIPEEDVVLPQDHIDGAHLEE